MFGVSSHSTRILPINVRVSKNTLQSEFRAIRTCPLFMGNTHHPLFMWNTHLSEFRAIRTNLNSVQQAHVFYSWVIHTVLCSCSIRTCLNFMQYAPIWIPYNKHTSFIHGQYTPSFVHVQYAPVWISYNTHQSEFMCSVHQSLFTCNTDQFLYSWQYAPWFISGAIRTNIHRLYTPYSDFRDTSNIRTMRLIWNSQGNTPHLTYSF